MLMFKIGILLVSSWLLTLQAVDAQATSTQASSPVSVGLGYYTILPNKLLLAIEASDLKSPFVRVRIYPPWTVNGGESA